MAVAPVLSACSRQSDRLAGAAGAGVRDNRDPARGLLDHHFDDTLALGGGQRRELTGRAAWHESVDARIDGAVDQGSQPSLVNFLLRGKRGCDRGVHTLKCVSHSLSLLRINLPINGKSY